MLFRLRKNVVGFADKKNNASVFSCVHTAVIKDVYSFAEVLSHEAQGLSVVVEKIEKLGGGGFVVPRTPNTVSVPIEETLKLLEENGFVISGNTDEELNEKEKAKFTPLSST